MIESWRSYGQLDMITLPEVAQNRANGILTVLHEILYGK
jgi:D-mannonate dehydratase